MDYSQGINPYMRVAYTYDWNEQNLMVGFIALNSNTYALDSNNLPVFGAVTHHQDKGIDAQYQYLLDPHSVTAHFRYLRENINDDTGTNANPDYLNSVFTKVTYVYTNQYGADLTYRSISGSSDVSLYTSANNSPNSKLWTPEIFWLPLQNLRLGLQYNIFTQYLGATKNYDGNKRNASDNNSAYLYAWVAF